MDPFLNFYEQIYNLTEFIVEGWFLYLDYSVISVIHF